MKTCVRWGTMILALALTAAAMAAPAVGQTINIKAEVPFDFVAGDVILKSGHCSLLTISNYMVRLTDSDNHSAVTNFTSDDLRSAGDAKLIFRRYGDRYFLARVETPEMSYKVPISNREMKLARKPSLRQVSVLAVVPARVD